MRLLEAPQTWIAVAVVLLVIAIVLLVLARRSRRTATRAAAGAQAAPTPEPSARASYHPEVDDADPATGPVDLRAVTTSPRPATAASPAPSAGIEPERTPTDRPTPDRPTTDRDSTDRDSTDQPAKDRLLAALLTDPQAAVRAVSSIDAANGSGPPGEPVASLLRAGLSPAQVASLCHVRESALAEIVARDLGLLTTRNATDDPGTAWPSLASAAGSTTPTTG